MDQPITDFLEKVKASDLSQADKDFIITTVSNEAMSAEDKGKALSEFFDKKFEEIDADEAKAGEEAIQKAQSELDALNTSFEASMAELDKEAEAAAK